jgi:hypothetical protein
MFNKSDNFGAAGGGGGGFNICWVIGIISSSICSSATVWNWLTSSEEDFHSKANNNIANERANPTSKKIPFLLSRSAFGDFFISILFNFYSSHNFAGKGKENHNICQDFKFFFSNIPALTIF